MMWGGVRYGRFSLMCRIAGGWYSGRRGEEYLGFIEESRRDMRPKSLIEAMGE